MTVRDIGQFLEDWAPAWTAWENDVVGLQIGDPGRAVRRVLVSLDVTPDVVREAAAMGAELILSHHPILLRPPKSIRTDEPLGALLHELARKRISVLSAHTNLDFAIGGVSFALARALGLAGARFLSHRKGLLAKLVVFVPETHADVVADALAQAGAGVIGQYTDCSFRTPGTGTYRGSRDSHPFLGKPMVLEHTAEVRLEMIVPRALVGGAVRAMETVQPYDKVAYDVYPVENPSSDSGEGVIGELPREMTLRSFLALVRSSLGARMLRFTGSTARRLRRIAVCGGSGSALLETAVAAGADAFVTADIRYHAFHEASGRIVLVDAGHYETEHVILRPLADRLRAFAKAQGDRLTVSVTRQRTNPVQIV